MKKNFLYHYGLGLFLSSILIFPFSLQAQQTFSNPEQAYRSLAKAVKNTPMTPALESVFGPGTSDLWNTGDAVQDQKMKDHFLARLEEGHRWVRGDENHEVLLLGKDSWPFPIPLMKVGKQWSYDLKTGREEILNRRVGANELEAIQNMKDYVRAQQEYAEKNKGRYAQKFWSDPGQKNGLYWESSNPQDQSPIGSKVLKARAEGYAKSSQEILLYHGYHYRMIQSGKGFGLLAYPAKWDDSGVMTFVVNQDGKVFQKNLGKDTLNQVAQIQSYPVNNSWKIVQN